MELFETTILIATAVYLIGMALVMHTQNFRSSMIFKLVPFLLGLGMLILILHSLGYIIPIG